MALECSTQEEVHSVIGHASTSFALAPIVLEPHNEQIQGSASNAQGFCIESPMVSQDHATSSP